MILSTTAAPVVGRKPCPTRRQPMLVLGIALLAGLSGNALRAAPAPAANERGLPFIRTYPLDEIGSVARGFRIDFDSFGRLAVMYDRFYSVLNDSSWVDRIDTGMENRILMTTVRVVKGNYFYGGRGSWGLVDQTPEGLLRAHPLVSPDAPAWTRVMSLTEMLDTPTGVYFYEINGVVYWDFARQRNFFFELPRVTCVFRVGDRVFASCEDRKLRQILPADGSIRLVTVPGLETAVVEHAARLDDFHVLLSLQDGRLVGFDGAAAVPWPEQARYGLAGHVSALANLVEGGVALALEDQGLFVIAADGALRWSLRLPEFRRIGSFAANEPGVLWVASENAVHKVFYDSPLTSFGQSLGLTATWPKTVSWNGRLVVGSSRTLYELEPTEPGSPSRFRPLANIPPAGAGTVAARDPHLLLGNALGVFAATENGEFVAIAPLANVASIEFIAPDLCLAIGSREIAALRYADGRWSECAERIAGVGDAPVRTIVRGAVWVEMGADRVARLTFRNGILSLERVPLPWSGGQWCNVGAVGDIVVISANTGQRVFYDEKRQALCAAPELAALLLRSPYWIARVTEDETGTLWATHTKGIVTYTPTNGDYLVDARTFELRNDSYPMVTVLPGNNIWVNCGRSLYHVERSAGRPIPPTQPVIVSMAADRHNLELLEPSLAATSREFAFDDNNLSFRLFSGTYAWRHPPLYEYRLAETEAWSRVGADLHLSFPKLRDGAYRLQVRSVVPEATKPPPLTVGFVIEPPWYRTPAAYFAYAALAALFIVGVARWTNYRSLQRNVALERLVHERTEQLEVAMEKLNDETRNAATLAERSRLAGEIHDSLQQSLSGSILQLDATMDRAALPAEVRSRLDVVRQMLGYTREEMKHAVWNLESPLLQNASLGDALREIVRLNDSGAPGVKVKLSDQPITLDPLVQHNLLRIAQEAITNAFKHAHANCIEVTLEADEVAVQLVVTDDGVGFDASLDAREGHFGLRGLHSRARAIRAKLVVTSAPDAGTIIRVTAPVSRLLPS